MSLNPSNFPSVATAVEIINFPENQQVHVNNSGFNCNNINLSNQSVMVKDTSQVYDANSNLCVTIQANDTDFATNTTLNAVQTQLQSANSYLADSNVYLNNIQTNTSSLPSATQATQSNTYLSQISNNTAGLATQSTLASIYNTINTKGQAQLFNGSTGENGASFAVDISSKNVRNLTFYGNSSDATTLTVQFSNDNINFFDSQYSYKISQSSDFGFTISSSSYYFKLKSSNNVNLVAYVNYV